MPVIERGVGGPTSGAFNTPFDCQRNRVGERQGIVEEDPGLIEVGFGTIENDVGSIEIRLGTIENAFGAIEADVGTNGNAFGSNENSLGIIGKGAGAIVKGRGASAKRALQTPYSGIRVTDYAERGIEFSYPIMPNI